MLCAQVAPSGECLRGKSPPDRMLAIPWRRLFLAAFGLTWLLWLSCVTDCCEVERFVLTTINEDYIMFILSQESQIYYTLHQGLYRSDGDISDISTH